MGHADYGYDSSVSFANDGDTAYVARGCLRRSQAIAARLRKGSAVVCVEYTDAPVSYGVKDRSCTYNHVQLVRLVVSPMMD